MTSQLSYAAANRPSGHRAANKTPVAASAALSEAGRGAFGMWDERDDLPALAMIIPLGILSIYTIWAFISAI